MMTAQKTDAPPRALVQSRDLTPAEARLLAVAAAKRVGAVARQYRLYWAGFILTIAGIIGWLVWLDATLSATGNSFHGLVMLLPMWAIIIGVVVMSRRYYVAAAAGTAAQFRAGSRFELCDDGLRIAMTDMHGVFAWHGITAIVPAGSFLYVHVGAVYMTGVPCGAIDNLDVAGFCAELERRWRAARGQPA